MTEHTQQEYIITEEQIKKLKWNCGSAAPAIGDMEKEIRSRPYPPPPTPCVDVNDEYPEDTPASTVCHGFAIDAVLRATVIETLRQAGCPHLAKQVMDDTNPNYHWCSGVSNTPKQAETMTDQQKYLIDDAMLLQWRAGCIRAAPINPDCNGCEFDNETRGGCDFDDDEMQKIFQSRPYNGVTLYTAGMVAHRIAHAKKEVLNEVIKIVMAYERKPKYDYEATLCSVIVESLKFDITNKEGQ